ncbi:MAG: sigma-70 family RNA polymerase sigma factor [Phycisphaerales bacterium]|nr:sigma-70 family RNA polymerase sigma factor [Phycisphaerales bacterium]
MSDSLLQRVANGDMAAMQGCIDTFGGLVWSLARRFLAPSEAEDAVQEAFISLWENAGRYDPAKGNEVTFVAMIARRRLIDRGRRVQRQGRVVDEASQLAPPAPVEPDTAVVATNEDATRALVAMESLTEAQQRVLRLSIQQGLTHEQIARLTELPLGTVKTHARRGLIRIRELLAPAGEGAALKGARP